MGMGKKIGISTGIVVAGFFAFIIMIGSLASVDDASTDQASATGNDAQQPSTQQPTASQPSINEMVEKWEAENNAQSMTTKPLTAMLPTRADIGTELTINEPKVSTNDYSDSTGETEWYGMGEMTNLKGFQEGVIETFGQRGNWFTFVARFDTSGNAKATYDEFIADMYAKGGYKELKPKGINAECYGRLDSSLFYDPVNIYCVKNNIYFHTYADEEYAVKFAKVVASRI